MFNLIVYSRDRACQCDLLLRSWQRFATCVDQPTVLYRATNADFACGYRRLANSFPAVRFIAEEDFRRQTLELLDPANAYTMWIMDDQIFRRPVCLDDRIVAPLQREEICCVSLPASPLLNYCYSLNLLTPFPPHDVWHADGNPWCVWRWRGASTGWNYPMSLDTVIFRTADLRPYLPQLAWSNPNTLEAVMAAQPLTNRPLMACRTEHCTANVPANRVQDVFPNRFMSGGATPAALNAAYLAGQVIDLDPLAAFENKSLHFEHPYRLVPCPES